MTTPERLEIQRGLPFPSNPNEPEYELIDLINGQSTAGLTIQSIWSPNIAAPENGGVWATSAGLDGRKPLSLQTGNVQEIIQLELNSQTQTELAKFWTKLQRWISEARDFGTTYAQTQPYYLHWQPAGGLSQYALIYNMNAVMQRISFSGELYQTNVTIDLEREGAWRKIQPFAYPDINLGTQLVENKHEYDPADPNGTPLSRNWYEISASDLPGDAPGLLQVQIGDFSTASIADLQNMFIGISSKPQNLNGVRDTPTFNTGDATLTSSGGVTLTKVTVGSPSLGVISNGVIALYRGEAVCVNGSTGGLISYNINSLLLRGRYSVFVRGGTNAGSSAIQCTCNYVETGVTRTVGTFTFPDTQVGLTYIGDLEIPQVGRTSVNYASSNGLGVVSNASLQLSGFINNTGGSQTVFIIDVVMIPIDEGAIYITPQIDATFARIYYDETGYIERGVNQGGVGYYKPATGGIINPGDSSPALIQGSNIQLNPNKDYKIFMLYAYNDYTAGFGTSTLQRAVNVNMRYVPRWYGVRDE